VPRFVIQQHDARSMHWDFRLEAGGVFKSWAVPRGPSTDPRDKRLAMEVDDHRLSWGDFEGVIPEGEYGAGPVIVWDRGSYRPLGDEPPARALEDGHLSFWLEGEKLRGGWTLRRLDSERSRAPRARRPEGRRWLLVKRRDDEADARRKPVSTQPESVVSGRRIDEVDS
jgi:DNA ligase D-like protein (predicted 3'-phosphoesterase)